MSRKIQRESAEMRSFLFRMLRAMVRRADEGDLDAAIALLDVERQAKVALQEAVAACRRNGFTWETIAQEMGMTKQNAQKRWGRDDD